MKQLLAIVLVLTSVGAFADDTKLKCKNLTDPKKKVSIFVRHNFLMGEARDGEHIMTSNVGKEVVYSRKQLLEYRGGYFSLKVQDTDKEIKKGTFEGAYKMVRRRGVGRGGIAEVRIPVKFSVECKGEL